MTPTVQYDPEVDALYIEFDGEKPWKRMRRFGARRAVDYAEDGSVLGVELLDARRLGVDLSDLPERETLERVLADWEIRILEGRAHGE
jgi:uncharacterized protein YuzE